MKNICIILLLLPLYSLSQDTAQLKKKKSLGGPYLKLMFEAVKLKDVDVKPSATLSFGGKIGFAGIGAGASIVSYNETILIPFFFEFTGYDPRRKKVSPYVNFKVGGTSYNKKVGTLVTTGGLFVSPSLGVFFPIKKQGIIVCASYVNYAFNRTIQTETKSYNIEGFSFGLGIKF